jgi:hypothetical protein
VPSTQEHPRQRRAEADLNTTEYVVIREAGALVTWLIVDDTDFVEVQRVDDPCGAGADVAECVAAIAAAQAAAEEHAGGLLPWVVALEDGDPRVCHTTRLVQLPAIQPPDMIG